MAQVEYKRLVFPLEMDGKEYLPAGGFNFQQPFLKLTFYDWQAIGDNKDEGKLLIHKQISSEFFFAMPETTIAENFDHQWNETTDFTRLAGVSFKNMVKWLADKSDIGQSILSAIEMLSGQKVNDFVAQSYDGAGFRQFEYLINMMPKNRTEALKIREIIDQLKLLTTPNYSKNIVIFPNICEASIFTKFDNMVYKTQLCGVYMMNINYAPFGNMRTHQDGELSAVQVNLGLRELKRITKDTITARI